MAEKWYQQNERGSEFFIHLSFYLVKFLPNFLLFFLIKIVVFFFFITSKKQRENIRTFRKNLAKKFGEDVLKNSTIWDHFESFGEYFCDKIAIWQNKIDFKRIIFKNEEILKKNFIENKTGKIILTSHFGNVEIARALAKIDKKIKIYILIYSKNMAKFNSIFKKNIKNNVEMIEVDELDINTMIKLKTIIDSGNHIAIMGDRMPINNNKFEKIDFLTKTANFPTGAYIIANLLKTGILSLWCEKIGKNFFLEVKEIVEEVKLKRDKNPKKYLEIYVRDLENHCKNNPTFWYNFFDFWEQK